jgi:hypothetical protein
MVIIPRVGKFSYAVSILNAPDPNRFAAHYRESKHQFVAVLFDSPPPQSTPSFPAPAREA